MIVDSKSHEVLQATIYNLGSCAARCLDFSRGELWARMSTPLRHKAVQIPVFLVNEAQMDILYPPERRKAIDPERANDWREKRRNLDNPATLQDLSDWREERRYSDNIATLQDLDPPSPEDKGPNPLWSRYERIVAMGLYVCNPKASFEVLAEAECKDDSSPTGVLGFSKAEETYKHHKGPHIYLCCERIVSVAKEKGIDPNLVLDKVYYHELGHAVLKGVRCFEKPEDDPYLETWGRIIEESAAEWISYVHFRGREELLVRKVLMESAPAEYRSCVVFHRIPLFPLPMAEPKKWDKIIQWGIRSGLRRFYEGWMNHWMNLRFPMRLCPDMLSLVEGTLLEDWVKSLRQQGLPRGAFFLFFDYLFLSLNRLISGPISLFYDVISPADPFWEIERVTTNPGTTIRPRSRLPFFLAGFNLSAWRVYKELGAPREPEYVIPLEEFAAALIYFSL